MAGLADIVRPRDVPRPPAGALSPLAGGGLAALAAQVPAPAPDPTWPHHLFPPTHARTLALYADALSVPPGEDAVIVRWTALQAARLTRCSVAIDTSTATAEIALKINGERRTFGLSRVVRVNDLDLFDTMAPGNEVIVSLRSTGTLAGVFVQLSGWVY